MEEADRKILYYLDLNCRSPVKKLANLTGLAVEKIEERIKHFYESGIVRRCYPELNRAKLGTIPFKVYLQFQRITPEKLKEIYEYLSCLPKTGWVATCSGRWDMIFAIFAESIIDFNKTYEEILSIYHDYILEKTTTITVDYFISNKAWLNSDAARKAVVEGGGIPDKSIDETDTRILLCLEKDGRAPVIDIAKKLNLEAGEVEERIKRMQKDGVIIAFQIDLDLSKVGRVFCKSMIYLTKSSKKEEEKLMEYCFRHPEITMILRCVGPWDLEIEADCESFKSFTELMNEIRNRYSSLVRNFEAVAINKESGTMFLPYKQ